LERELYFFLQKIYMTIDPNTLSTPRAILEAALNKEKAAYRFYDQLLSNLNV